MKQRLPTKGFTLIELLIYLSLTAAIALIFTLFISDVVKNAIRTMTIKEVNQSSRFLISRISQEIKTAQEITAISINQLNLKNAANQSIAIYWQSADQMVYYDNGTGPIALANDTVRVTQLDFVANAGGVVTVNLTVAQKNPAARPLFQYQLPTTVTVIPRQLIY